MTAQIIQLNPVVDITEWTCDEVRDYIERNGWKGVTFDSERYVQTGRLLLRQQPRKATATDGEAT